MLVNFSEREDEDWQYWIDANIAAGVSFSFNWQMWSGAQYQEKSSCFLSKYQFKQTLEMGVVIEQAR